MIFVAIAFSVFWMLMYFDARRENISLRRQFSLYKYSFRRQDFVEDCSVFANIPGEEK